MSAKSLQQMLAIKNWLSQAINKLSDVDNPNPNLDAELILCFVIKKDRSYLRAHDDQMLKNDEIEQANLILRRRLQFVPIAYITGYKEFYGRDFIVNNSTLIPRPESEDIITLLKDIILKPIPHFPNSNPQLVDVGTGSGCLGITAKLELPSFNVTLLDISADALNVAQKNAEKMQTDVDIIQSLSLIHI